ncbi:hypothetical protein LCGC14_2446080, partial [marine sediment metagenome]
YIRIYALNTFIRLTLFLPIRIIIQTSKIKGVNDDFNDIKKLRQPVHMRL